MNDGKIYIYISHEPPASGQGGAVAGANGASGTNGNGGGTTTTDNDSLMNHWARSHLLNTTKQIAKQAVTFSISNIGNFSGDYITQTHVKHSFDALSGLASVGMGALAGFKYGGGPIGAVIGASLAVVSQTITGITNIISGMVENSKINYEIAQLKDRSGLNTYVDGSRGTYD